ncbi:ABC transporter substrate-binding protein [Actinomadura montaniterrae]|uniref:Iron-siderophore ABC transporter substrate-binding protein n=1 Tax=Actinomadura montaniterrae TaxID=1803903 RepID=A0A6L3VFA8_9ACTN|nr:iron-siderophore ABC transporter substrate-binding protein [Actinomadura montaniterrae]KAB2364121.1 iron-siderophore ABC transporter substrate-binding protein [Actinomadura montaniterrae]
MKFRRSAALAAALLAGALTVAGCGSGDDGSGPSGAKRSVTDATGATVSVPAAPKRVVALSEPTMDAALALGVRPVGTTSGRGQTGVAAYLAPRAKDVPIVANVAQPDLEKIIDLRPDLILLDETVGAKSVRDKLKDIAPTVLTAKLNAPWRDAFLATADALGKKPQAAQWLTGFDTRVSAVKAKLGANAGAVTSVIRWQNGAPSVVGKGKGHVGETLTALGLTRPADQRGAGVGHSEPVSLEKLDTIDGDWLFFGALGDESTSRKALAEAEKTPTFTRLKAAKEKHVVTVDGSAWNSAGGPLAAGTVLTDVQTAMAS